MKGRAVSREDQKLWDALASIGCIACRKEGVVNPWVSIHHIQGRTKPGAHKLVLPLCYLHHQGGDGVEVVSVHPWKARFEAKYGSQMDLLEECKRLMEG